MKKVCIIDCGSNKTDNIIKIVEDNNMHIERWYLYYPTIDFKLNILENFNKVILVKQEKNNFITSNFDKEFTSHYKSIIFSGGGLLQDIQKEIKSFFSYLKHIKIPVLGICFGHQLIALVYETKLYQLTKKVSGNYKTQFTKKSEIIEEHFLNQTILFKKNHTEAISLPKDFFLVAKSATCQVEMIQHKQKNIFGTQFHPEVSGKNGERIIINFLNLKNDLH